MQVLLALLQGGVGGLQHFLRLTGLLLRGQALFAGVGGQGHTALHLLPVLRGSVQVAQQRLDSAQLGQLRHALALAGQLRADVAQLLLGFLLGAL